ncbi:MAG TPA: DUF4249 domain-containing protein [Chryseosolibacter sp.]
MKIKDIVTPLFFILVLAADGCIDRYEVPKEIKVAHLVVDGLITNAPGPYQVELFRAFDLNTFINKRISVENAVVQISDDAGNTETLTEVAPGIYQTAVAGIRGVVGRSYQLSVRTESDHYISTPQLLVDGGQIPALRYEFDEFAVLKASKAPEAAVNFFIDSKGTPGEKNYFRWRWSSVYETKNNPELKTREEGRPPRPVPAPPPCSGYRRQGNGIVRFDICSCCNCWVSEQGSNVTVSKNSSVVNDQFVNVQIASVPMADRKFHVRYYFKVDQLSVSEEVYDFWKLVESQQLGEGSLFQPNAVRVLGNIRSTTKPEEQVLGVFSASGIVSREVFIQREEIPFTIPDEPVRESCLLRPGASNTKPLFW